MTSSNPMGSTTEKRGIELLKYVKQRIQQANRQSLLFFIIVHKLNYHMARSQDLIS